MKTLTCRDLGGPCDAAITGSSFREAGKKCHDHVMEQIKSGDEAHKLAADEMRSATAEQQAALMAAYERNYNEAPEL